MDEQKEALEQSSETWEDEPLLPDGTPEPAQPDAPTESNIDVIMSVNTTSKYAAKRSRVNDP